MPYLGAQWEYAVCKKTVFWFRNKGERILGRLKANCCKSVNIAVKDSLWGFCFMLAHKPRQSDFSQFRKPGLWQNPQSPAPHKIPGAPVDNGSQFSFQPPQGVGFDLVLIPLPLPSKGLVIPELQLMHRWCKGKCSDCLM